MQNCPHAMLINTRAFVGSARQVVVRVVLRIDRAGFEKVRRFVENRHVAGHQHVAACRQRQPKIIIRAMRAHAAPPRGMPPMLDVAFDELAARTERNLRAHKLRLGVNQGHHVLQLVAETVGSARLVVAAARPQAAGHRLIHEPAIGQYVEGHIGRFHLHGSKRVPPVPDHCLERFAGGRRPAETLHQWAGRIGVACCAQSKNDLPLLPIRQVEGHLDRGAGIQPGTQLAGKARPVHGRRIAQRAVATEKFAAVSSHAPSRVIDVEEADPVRELVVVRISCVDRSVPGIDLGRHVHRRFRAKVAQYPLDVARRG